MDGKLKPSQAINMSQILCDCVRQDHLQCDTTFLVNLGLMSSNRTFSVCHMLGQSLAEQCGGCSQRAGHDHSRHNAFAAVPENLNS